MTAYDKIKEMGKEEMAKFLCDLFLMSGGCSGCPEEQNCNYSSSGWTKFLEAEYDGRYTT